MSVPAKSVLNMLKDLQAEVAALQETVRELQETETVGSNADHTARIETIEKILWGKDE